ncbi:ABC transporter permease [Variovorax sp. J31P207]|uniref:ABC transporter permease n=1 Tax=Variovorax sp. J31P207 TaxID=3053510 RepID=UPI002579224C|nr:ABC transporter permease [Variovorax sp. J31P207]MDM0071508.1 ABC transporter permease [Variovorax sp. J31P207]
MNTSTSRTVAAAVTPSWRHWFGPAHVHANAVRALCIALFVAACLWVPNFASTSNIAAILYAAAAVGMAAVGLAAVTLSGNLFSLSLGATAAFASIVFAEALGLGPLPAALLGVALGAVTGAIQGFVVGVLRCNPIITSIAIASMVTGAASLWSGGRTIMGNGDASWLGSGALWPGLPYQALLVLVAVLILDYGVQRTRIGRELRLVGTNRAAAELAGLRTRTAVVMAYVLSGVTAAAAGVLIGSQSGTGNLLVGADLDFSAIAAVLVGGVAINGGRGRVVDAAVGAIFLALLENILLVNGFSYEVQLMVKGAAVLIAVAFSALATRRRK